MKHNLAYLIPLFFLIFLFWPILYIPLGSFGLFLLYTISILPLIFFTLASHKLPKTTLKVVSITLVLLAVFVIGQFLYPGDKPLQSLRFALLPLSYLSGYLTFYLLPHLNVSLRLIKSAILFFFTANIVVILLSLLSPVFAASFSNLYGQGALFSSSYLATVRYFGFSGQPAISAHVTVFLLFIFASANHIYSTTSSAYVSRRHLQPLSSALAILFSTVTLVATVSRTSMVCLAFALCLSTTYFKLPRILKNQSISKLTAIFILLVFSLASAFQPFVALFAAFYNRLDNISNLSTASIRMIPYQLILEQHSVLPITIPFGFFLNTSWSISINPALYVTDSFVAFVFSHLGILGLFATLILFAKLIYVSARPSTFLPNRIRSTSLLSPLAFSIYLFTISLSDPALLDSRALYLCGFYVAMLPSYKQNSHYILPSDT